LERSIVVNRFACFSDNRRRRLLRNIEARVVDRGFRLHAGCAAMVFSCGEADEAGFWVGPGRRGRERMMRPSDRATECWERIEERRQSSGKSAILIDVESGGRPVHAPSPKRRPLFRGGANQRTKIIVRYKSLRLSFKVRGCLI